MNLNGILALIQTLPSFKALVEHLQRSDEQRDRNGASAVVLEGAKAPVIGGLALTRQAPLLILSAREGDARRMKDALALWLEESADILLFPEREAFPYERLMPNRRAIQERLMVLERLRANTGRPTIIVSDARAAVQRTISQDELSSAVRLLTTGESISADQFLAHLVFTGYKDAPQAQEPGQFSRRGGIIDVFPATAESPLRIELAGNRIESLRNFDATNQRSTGELADALVGPAREMMINPHPSNGRGLTDTEALPIAGLNELLPPEAIFADADYYTSYLATSSLLEHLHPSTLVICDEPSEIISELEKMAEQAQEVYQDLVKRGELPGNLPLPYIPPEEFTRDLGSIPLKLDISRWPARSEDYELPFSPPPTFGGRLSALAEFAQEHRSRSRSLVIVSQQAARLADVLLDAGVPFSSSESMTDPPGRGEVRLQPGNLPAGWQISDGGADLALLTDTEVFGVVKKQRERPPRRFNREAFLSDLAAGDYLVHIDHGIGRFSGLVRRTIGDREGEYLEIHYADGDRLFVPSDQLDRLSRYTSPADRPPVLTRLRSQEWARTKERVRRATAELAQELLSLHASRELLAGHSFHPDSPWQREVETAFPYEETPDQINAMREIKTDMESPRPMDRLVCGDVGYGKTELAIRTAFKAISDGAQVAMLVPTTILAQQHFDTFNERLAGFPVRVEVLSRFRSEEDQRRVLNGLASGSVDLVIGTHRLLQKDVKFKTLGLVIIDEEQRFGVSHKEHLKKIRQNVDLLTLSATPIPRTLYMAMSSIRDISTIETPPEERLPIKTYVAEYDEKIVRDAILREMERGGQVYFVHNRVRSIGHIAQKLERVVPEARIIIAHGQMPEDQLQQAIQDFAARQADLLLCTTIIESGLDMPNANTMIINQANRFGLAQLYQLRGRIGRSDRRAYAYLFYDHRAHLTEAAQMRLQAVFEASELGAGFQIALRDLEIRGAGNLLGPEQSGQMAAVGVDLYTQLLSEAVGRLRSLRRGEAPQPASPPPATIELPVTAYIPDEYVPDPNQRLSLYQRMAGLITLGEADSLAQEMADRFGPLPDAAVSLLYVVRLRILGRIADIRSITIEEGQIIVRCRSAAPLPREVIARDLRGFAHVSRNEVRMERRGDSALWQARLLAILDRLAAVQAGAS